MNERESWFYLLGPILDGRFVLVQLALVSQFQLPSLRLSGKLRQQCIKFVEVVVLFHSDPPLHWENVGPLVFQVLELQHIMLKVRLTFIFLTSRCQFELKFKALLVTIIWAGLL
jgi:hypothetical protein